MRRRWRVILGYVAAALAAALLYMHHLIGGPLFQPVLPADGAHSDVAIVTMSGDMGVDFGQTGDVARRFAKAGVPVIAVNSHDFFTSHRTPDEIVGLISRGLDRAAATGAKRLVVVGHSYGADMLQAGLAHMPPAERARIAAVVLVVPGKTLFFRISWGERYDWIAPEADARPSGRQLTWVPTLCVSGAKETESLCPALDQPNVEHVVLPGGHLLNRDADGVFAAIRAFIGRHTA